MSITGKNILFYGEHPKCKIGVFSEKFINFFKSNYKNINVNFYVMDTEGNIHNPDIVYNDHMVQLVINTIIDKIIKEDKLLHNGVYEDNKLLITFEDKKTEVFYKIAIS